MFERFTERARQVIVLAQEEARSSGHREIGTGHIIVGLLREEEGLAARILAALDVDIADIRKMLLEHHATGDVVPSGVQIPFTVTAKKALEVALREALSLGHNYIGTEHILLGVNRVAAAWLPDGVRDEALRMLRGSGSPAEAAAAERKAQAEADAASRGRAKARRAGADPGREWPKIPRDRARRLVRDTVFALQAAERSVVSEQQLNELAERVMNDNPDVADE